MKTSVKKTLLNKKNGKNWCFFLPFLHVSH